MQVREVFVSTKRESGLSDREVILSLVAPLDYGTVVTYGQFIEALDAGAERLHDRKDVQIVVNRLSKGALLTEHRKRLVAVNNVGYRVAHPEEHASIAQHHTKKSYRQALDACRVVRNADTSSMSEAERAIHVAQCVINEALLAENRKFRRKAKDDAKMFANLTHRVEQLEGAVTHLKDGHQ